MFTILVVEDDAKLRQLFCTVLTRHGYRTVPAVNGEDALAMLDKEYIDLMICDIMMPVMDGFELTRMIRDNNSQLPVLMVTARENFADKQQGFLVGIDDYMVKPVNVNEMLLRVGALLRRAKIISERKIEWAETVLDYDTLTVIQGPERIVLPQKEFYLLYKMISYPNKIFTKQQLMDEIWGMDSESDEHTVVVHINRLRERFRDNPDFEIVTVRGLGYKAVKQG
ncbi:response regulator transcription factor [Paenibacillus sp. FSL H8-0122]|uniref:response regulator transcription factor n=1 Tax=unclassified Paenibacillus TaxID=185978 RepID=UPI00096BEC6C|nr:DNA-binding response regulator [Paenibacillus sp. FSL R7-0333]